MGRPGGAFRRDPEAWCQLPMGARAQQGTQEPRGAQAGPPQGATGTPAPAPPMPGEGPGRLSAPRGRVWDCRGGGPGGRSPMEARALQSRLWKSAQALVLQFLLQASMP